MYVLKFFINYDKEEKWLKSMAEKGYELIGAVCGYSFRSAKPESPVIKIDFRQFKSQKDFVDYCTLFEDSGWRHIAGTKSSGNQYFKKISDNGDADIFSDKASKAGRYKRLSNMWLSLAAIYLPLIVVFWNSSSVNLNAIIHPKLLYLTPGLWEMQGSRFWGAFLFETPFALFRGFGYLYPIIFTALYFLFAYKANKLYKEEKSNETI